MPSTVTPVPNIERIMTARYLESTQTLCVYHPQWGEIARWTLKKDHVHDYFPAALQSEGPHHFPTELYRLIKENGASSLHDYGLLHFHPQTDAKVKALLLQAYQQERKVLIIEVSPQENNGKLFCTTPMFVQAGAERSPRLNEEIYARDGLSIPPNILHVVFSD